MAKRSGSFTFTFSKQNQDVKDLLERKQRENPSFVRSNYMCEAVRFYESFKNKKFIDNTLDSENLKSLIVSALQQTIVQEQQPIFVQKVVQEDTQKDENVIRTTMDFDDVSDDDCDDD